MCLCRFILCCEYNQINTTKNFIVNNWMSFLIASLLSIANSRITIFCEENLFYLYVFRNQKWDLEMNNVTFYFLIENNIPESLFKWRRNVVCTLVFACQRTSTIRDINLVDPASSHTLVSKIKPCMSKYKQFCTVKLRMAHYISYSLLDSTLLLG